ncbi:PREDICTED: interleukin-17C [Chrysochloris asiatica]|uniref:Interleukin-17C n=1 Tax=Chrysochloris asiatica TaxID=185453 RepID=A0A9B0T8A3_CHRAS|nr:PREDICTED: interleukin-17C [Chrysochloris asiatica]
MEGAFSPLLVFTAALLEFSVQWPSGTPGSGPVHMMSPDTPSDYQHPAHAGSFTAEGLRQIPGEQDIPAGSLSASAGPDTRLSWCSVQPLSLARKRHHERGRAPKDGLLASPQSPARMRLRPASFRPSPTSDPRPKNSGLPEHPSCLSQKESSGSGDLRRSQERRDCLPTPPPLLKGPGQHLQELLLLLWLPANLAHHAAPLRGPHTQETTRCYSADELTLGQPPQHLLARSARWEQTLPVTLVSSVETAGRRRRQDRSPAENPCPVLRPEQVLEAEIHQRSISPWRYRIDTDENRYPKKLAFAECLCRGCIDARSGRETTALNSVQLSQSLLVIRRRPCAPHGAAHPQPGAVTFQAEFIRVPVGCTCVVPRSTQ